MATCLLWSAIENHLAIFITCAPSIKALVAGTLVPLVTSSYETIREKMKRSSGSDFNSTGVGSFGTVHPPTIPHNTPLGTLTSAPGHVVNKVLDQFRTRSGSVASNDSGFNHIMQDGGAPWDRKGSASSAGSSQRTYSKSSLKEPAVTVYAMDELAPSPPRIGHLPSCPDLEAQLQSQVKTPAPVSRFERD